MAKDKHTKRRPQVIRKDEDTLESWKPITRLGKKIKDGSIIDTIQLEEDDPYPHGMSIKDNKMWISDANFGGKQHSDTLMGKPSFSIIEM